MHMIHGIALTILISLHNVAMADCDLTSFDRSAPTAIRSSVSNDQSSFDWATDVDTIDGYRWIWHFVRNTGENGFGYRWTKANLRRALGSPLPSGRTDCIRFYVNDVEPKPDDNAPITYGATERVQPATVFATTRKVSTIPPPTLVADSEKTTTSIISTSYFDKNTKTIRDVAIRSYSSWGGGIWSLEISLSPGERILIPRRTTKGAARVIERIPNSHYFYFDRDFKRETVRELLQGIYSKDEIEQHLSDTYAMLSSTKVQYSSTIPPEETNVEVILVDQSDRPVLATEVTLILPVPRMN